MHLKSCPKLVRSELRLDAVGVQTSSQRSGLFVSQQGGLLKSSNHGNFNNSRRLPLSVISTNTLRCGNTAKSNVSVASLRLKPPCSAALKLLPPECDTLTLHQTATEDAEIPLDIWTVIKPGHVREKIAIFASEGGRTKAGGSERSSSCSDHAEVSGLTRGVKVKGSREENCSAKRRRRSGGNQVLQQGPGSQHDHTPPPSHLDAAQRSAVGWRDGEEATEAAEEEEEPNVSVVEMVAFLEQRASEQQTDCKPQLALQRSSTTITLSRAPAPEVRAGSEVRGEELESIRVSDMVAKLESECLRRRGEGGLSRSNSLRTVGRVLLTAGDQSSAPSVTSSLSGTQSPISCSETPSRDTCLPSDHAPFPSSVSDTQTVAPPSQPEAAEPLPGLLFLSAVGNSASAPSPTDSEPRPPPAVASSPESEKSGRRLANRCEEEVVGRRASVASQDFLEKRQRLQQLLEPQPLLAALPHHLLVKILLLLPTQSLAALKCTCVYFRFLIENYGVRPADSLWVCDPRYRDDPCKQCKRRYDRGDVSLCRWHHKPYCQALPYGPGYWMCCHGAHRNSPGCNVGLHDNRWVPAFHSINVPIYRRRSHDDCVCVCQLLP
uniref:F-box protein 34 n=1 Tax=Scophthalmus maximus TaxID=52904 RepID=A0A8D2ZJZ7_SCOMX